MFEVVARMQKVRLDYSVLYREIDTLADDLAKLMTGKIQIALLSHGKKVSGDTLTSIRWQRTQATTTFQRRQVTGGGGFKFIVSGRRAGAKMPVYLAGKGPRGGKVFEPLPLMLRWFVLKGIPQHDWWPIMRTISRKGIRPTDIPTSATWNAMPEIRRYGLAAGVRIASQIVKVDGRR